MKKLILSLGLMFAATFALTNCTKNDEANNVPVLNGPKYELFAEPADTRTALDDDGVSTKWLESDSINVFHAVAGTTNYKSDGDFDFDAATSGRFTGTLAEKLAEGTEYDWYLFYPYTSQITTPANDKTGWTVLGCNDKSGFTQTQTGNDSKVHLAGSICPLYGKATATYPESLKVQMNHLASVIAVKVTNDDANEIVVKSVSFTAPESIVGTYYMNIAGSEVKYTASGDNYVSATAKLSVTNGAAIAAEGGSATFYMLVKPFTAAAGDKLSLSVTTDQGTCAKSLTLPNDVAFTAGKIKTLNIGFTAPNEKDVTWNLATKSASSATENAVLWDNDIASMLLEKGESSQAANSYYGNSNTRIYTNQTLTITPKDGYIIKRVEFTGTTNNYIKALQSSTWTNATASINGALVTVTPADGTTAIKANIGGTCRLTEVVIFYEEGSVTPTIKADDIVDVAAAGIENATATITLKGLDGVAVNAAGDGTVVTAASVSGNTLTYTVSKNETFEAREGKITLSAEGATEVTIKVSQLAREVVTLTLSKEAVELEATDEETHEDITFTSDGTVTAKACNDAEGESDCDWLVAYVSGTAISYMAEANTGAERVAYIVVTATLDGNNINKSVKVTQKKGAGALTESVIYSTAFDYKLQGSSYASASEIIGEDADGKQWAIVYGNWNGNNCAQLRVYSTGNFGSVYTKFDLAKVTKVTYKAQVSNIALKLNTYYSTDSGKTWTKVDSAKALTTTLTEYTFEVSSAGEYENVRIKFEVAGTKPTSKNYQLTIDDVAVYGLK